LPVAAHQIFDSSANGFKLGVADFSMMGIEPKAMIDPTGQRQFVTRLTFAGVRADGPQRHSHSHIPIPIPIP